MNCPRVEVDLSKIRHNSQTLVARLKARCIRVTAVTKAVCGHRAIAQTMLDGGVDGLADARLSNVQSLREAGNTCPITLIRTPMLSQADDVVRFCDASYNTQMTVIAALAAAALRQKKVHGILLMVEMGDLREGIMPQDLGAIAQQVADMPGVALTGVGANFACLNGTAPNSDQMRTLSDLATDVERRCGAMLQTVSGGNSANLPWALGGHSIGRINDLRLGEAILLGVDPVTGDRINGLFHDAFKLVAEVIEVSDKSARSSVSAAGPNTGGLRLVPNEAKAARLLLALGKQDTDVLGLSMPAGHTFIGATSDHLVISSKQATLSVGSEISFQMNYSALMQAMAAPDIQTKCLDDVPSPIVQAPKGAGAHLALI